MRTVLCLFAICSLIMWSCQSALEQEQQAIADLEAAVESNPDEATAMSLVEAYRAYVEQHPEETEQNARYLYRAAGLLYRMNRFPVAIDLLQQGLRDFPNAEINPQAAYLLATIYRENLQDEEMAYSLLQQLQQAYPDFTERDQVAAQLPADLPDFDQRMNERYQQIFRDSLGSIDFKAAGAYLKHIQLASLIHPDDPQTPARLHQAGEVARSTRAFNQAVSIYRQIMERYPNYEKAPQSMFLLAFTLDNDFEGRDEEAREIYEEFIQRYPNEDFAEDAKFLIENLGKTDEEIIQSFEQRQQ